MTEAEAKFIMGEIHRIDLYNRLIDEYRQKLAETRQELDDLASLPSSGNFDRLKTENSHVELSTKINGLLSKEQETLERKNDKKKLRDLALMYKQQVIAQTNGDPFMVDYINKVSYRKLTHIHGWENPYEHMISVMKGLDIH